jgi:SAM-dependent methyltransferase
MGRAAKASPLTNRCREVTMTRNADEIHDEVRRYYADAAKAAAAGQSACCGPDTSNFGVELYEGLDDIPEAAQLASIGCGNPTVVADLRPGETVLDLGSGGGIDVLLSARRVGPTGRAYGLDMTDEMLALARQNAAEAAADNVEFIRGHIEDIPLPDEFVDVIISNCVINLSPNKPAVFAEMYRVLKPGGRIGISDVVTEDRLTDEERLERGTYVGCIAGALSVSAYTSGLESAGFSGVSVTFTHAVGDGVHGAIVQASKP